MWDKILLGLLANMEVGKGEEDEVAEDNVMQNADGTESMDVKEEIKMVDLEEVKVLLDTREKESTIIEGQHGGANIGGEMK